MDKNNWIRLHRSPKICREPLFNSKQEYYYQQSRKRWLQYQDGYETEKILKKALLVGELGTISGCCLHSS